MAGVSDWNAKIITEFRANQGRVGPPFEGCAAHAGASPWTQDGS